MRETERSRRAVLSAVNPEDPASPMAMLKASLSRLLLEQSTSQLALVMRQE